MSLVAPLYPQHLSELQRRTAQALERGGFDHLVVPSGTLHYQVFDDRDYPYAVNPQFKAWLPLTRAPGSWLVVTPGARPKLLFLQPHDYWHVVPAAPEGYWVPHFDIQVIRTPEEAVEKANNTPYGLSAGVWTDKGSRILKMASELKAGVVWANTYNKFDPSSPFGGYKQSGFGREGGKHGLLDYASFE